MMSTQPPLPQPTIACQQVLLHDASVFSIQWLDFPPACAAELTPARLLERYLRHVRRFTLSLVRPAVLPTGVELRLLVAGPSLISFAPPLFRTEGEHASVTLDICGGVLVQPNQCDRGELALIREETATGIRVAVQLSDYCPLLLGSTRPSWLHRWLYRLTQAYLHKMVTLRFLARLYREVAPGARRFRIVKVQVQDGTET
jgi:hypothetical protein